MEKSLPIFTKFWKEVVYYRENIDELKNNKRKNSIRYLNSSNINMFFYELYICLILIFITVEL